MPTSGNERIEVLFSEEQIKRRVTELGQEITRDYRGRELVLLCVLKGSYVFGADLARAIDLPLRVEFLGVRSYGDRTRSTGAVQITQDLTAPVAGLDLLVVEDIVDTGLTLSFLLDMLRARQPSSVRVCALLHKPSQQIKEVSVDYLGFTVGDVFVVGYGLDHAEHFRNLPYVGVVAKEATAGACAP
jgi:hypoxanthine phosphoribosyltransferase